MKDVNKNILRHQLSRFNRDSSDLFYGNPFEEKYFSDVIFHFEQVFNWHLKDIRKKDEFFEIFEEEYKRFFEDETSDFSPPFFSTESGIYALDYLFEIWTMGFGYISEFHDFYIINRNGENLYLAEHLLDLFQDEFKLFFILEDGENLDPGNFDHEEIYPDIFFELKNKEYLNDQGFYRELYQEMIQQLFFE